MDAFGEIFKKYLHVALFVSIIDVKAVAAWSKDLNQEQSCCILLGGVLSLSLCSCLVDMGSILIHGSIFQAQAAVLVLMMPSFPIQPPFPIGIVRSPAFLLFPLLLLSFFFFSILPLLILLSPISLCLISAIFSINLLTCSKPGQCTTQQDWTLI